MRKWTVRAARAVLVGAAFAAVGTGIANADTTSGDHSVAGGTQVPVTAPNLLAGSVINVLSPHSNSSTGSTQRLRYSYHRSHTISATSIGGSSIGSDNQVAAPVTAPIIICGNAISAEGLGTATCKGHASITSGASQASSACNASCAQAPTTCNAACAPAAQVPAAPAAPVCSQACAKAPAPAKPAAPVCSQACQQVGAPTSCQETCAQHSAQSTDMARNQFLSNNQAMIPVTAPIMVCGNSGAIRGIAAASCDGDASFTKNAS